MNIWTFVLFHCNLNYLVLRNTWKIKEFFIFNIFDSSGISLEHKLSGVSKVLSKCKRHGTLFTGFLSQMYSLMLFKTKDGWKALPFSTLTMSRSNMNNLVPRTCYKSSKFFVTVFTLVGFLSRMKCLMFLKFSGINSFSQSSHL